MAIYGVGAYFDRDLSGEFIANEFVGVVWDSKAAPELHEYFRTLKVGDIVYIKAAFGGVRKIKVKGIGIVRDGALRTGADTSGVISMGRNVIWLNTEDFEIARPREKNNVRSNAVYEEFHPIVQFEIINRIARARGA